MSPFSLGFEAQVAQGENNFWKVSSPDCFCLFLLSEKSCCLFANDSLASLQWASCSLSIYHKLSLVAFSQAYLVVFPNRKGEDQCDLEGQFRQILFASSLTVQLFLLIKHQCRHKAHPISLWKTGCVKIKKGENMHISLWSFLRTLWFLIPAANRKCRHVCSLNLLSITGLLYMKIL